MTGDDWCHFSLRLARSRDHMIAKERSVPFEDERYAYVVVTREKVATGARIIKPPLETKPGLTLPLCERTACATRSSPAATRMNTAAPASWTGAICSDSVSRMIEGVELVAVEIAEIGGIGPAAFARRAFILAPRLIASL